MIQRAIASSNKANADPTFANEACSLWCDILDDTRGQLPLPIEAMSAAHGLYASTLVRIGRDKQAVIEYKKSLTFLRKSGAFSNSLTKEEADIRLGMGKSLQRMLRYDESANVFMDVAERCMQSSNDADASWIEVAYSESIQSAALCHMRSNDLDTAISVLEKFEGYDNAEIAGMKGAALLLQLTSTRSYIMKDSAKYQRAYELLNFAHDKTDSPIYKWIHLLSSSAQTTTSHTSGTLFDVYLSFARVNNSPFDDPGLVALDDKVLFHSMIMNSHFESKDFWPQGFILAKEWDAFLDISEGEGEGDSNKKSWILKERSGYGSHGNSIVSTGEVLSLYKAGKLNEILCQRLVDPPMLLNGRKFSLRIYVVYFPAGNDLTNTNTKMHDAEIYISTDGLAKYANERYQTSNVTSLDDQYQTNSGRGNIKPSKQHNLHQLRSEFQMNGYDYDQMWGSIERSVQMVMKRYVEDDSIHHRAYMPLYSVPKIMGFDFILDSSADPYLLEVNRFPGLEPRSSMDADVKHSIVYDAWDAACIRARLPKEYIQNLIPRNYQSSSLKRISIT